VPDIAHLSAGDYYRSEPDSTPVSSVAAGVADGDFDTPLLHPGCG